MCEMNSIVNKKYWKKYAEEYLTLSSISIHDLLSGCFRIFNNNRILYVLLEKML